VKRYFLVLLLALMPAAANAQQPPRGNPQQDRAGLQRAIVQRFMEHVTYELGLDLPTRMKLEQHIRQSGERRRQLAQSTGDLRARMMRSSRDSTTPDSEFRKMLAETSALRQREEDLWKQDMDDLSKILTPRQHARYVFLWLRFQEQVREAAMRGPGAQRPF